MIVFWKVYIAIKDMKNSYLAGRKSTCISIPWTVTNMHLGEKISISCAPCCQNVTFPNVWFYSIPMSSHMNMYTSMILWFSIWCLKFTSYICQEINPSWWTIPCILWFWYVINLYNILWKNTSRTTWTYKYFRYWYMPRKIDIILWKKRNLMPK